MMPAGKRGEKFGGKFGEKFGGKRRGKCSRKMSRCRHAVASVDTDIIQRYIT